MPFPNTLDTFSGTTAQGTSLLATSPDHAGDHRLIGSNLFGLTRFLGVSGGTNVFGGYQAGWIPLAINGGTPQASIPHGTYTNSLISGGTIGTAQWIGGTIAPSLVSGSVIGSANIIDAAVTSRKMKLDQIQVVATTQDVNYTGTAYAAWGSMSITYTPQVPSNYLVLLQVNNYDAAATGENFFAVEFNGTIQGNDPLISRYAVSGDQTFPMSQSGFLWITGVGTTAGTIQVYTKVNAGATMHTTYAQMLVIPFAS